MTETKDFNMNQTLLDALDFERETRGEGKVTIWIQVNDLGEQREFTYPLGEVVVRPDGNDPTDLVKVGTSFTDEYDAIGFVTGFRFQ